MFDHYSLYVEAFFISIPHSLTSGGRNVNYNWGAQGTQSALELQCPRVCFEAKRGMLKQADCFIPPILTCVHILNCLLL